MCQWRRSLKLGISIHAPARGATRTKDDCWKSHYFNSRPCERGDQYFEDHKDEIYKFQFTPLREGRLSPQGNAGAYSLFQFTPLREGRRQAGAAIVGGLTISIHAPARGATAKGRARATPSPNFNSRPCERGDCKVGRREICLLHFNSRPCERGDKVLAIIKTSQKLISIHAPARGATTLGRCSASKPSDFNSRPCERGDLLHCLPASSRWHISIHAPARGATNDLYNQAYGEYISIHAPARGATGLFRDDRRFVTLISIHAPARGATQSDGVACRAFKFQFTPLREG